MKVRIGIDPGRSTGIAITVDGKLRNLDTMLIHEAMDAVRSINVPDMVVIVEDARKRSGSPQAAQGAGSVKRDCTIWEDFLESLKIGFKMVAPIRNGTKFRDQIFKAHYPYWTKRTSEHSRSAANLLITKS
ncbi:MAG TPA: hypothetical protein PKL22_10535 [Saprospiraceae bacterium]|nr:hypothetical protein [Saprospiraceae bacterium]HNT22624.1 hypothetical protein [Saprospiraceae bacterium]